jgi:hypothetical protein
MTIFLRILTIAIVTTAVGIMFSACGRKCAPEMLESLPVPGSEWTVEAWLAACGFGINGPLEVRAVNAKNKEVVHTAQSRQLIGREKGVRHGEGDL